jgi:hypothetical protein
MTCVAPFKRKYPNNPVVILLSPSSSDSADRCRNIIRVRSSLTRIIQSLYYSPGASRCINSWMHSLIQILVRMRISDFLYFRL